VSGNFSIVPIRFEDRMDILKWRNEQIYHLRQAQILTIEMQDHYYDNTISKLFAQEQPDQILFSFMKDNVLVGYGGLVHINWIDKNAEISFIMKTELEKDSFDFFWMNYLFLLQKVAFDDLQFHKIFTYAFDLRPHLYKTLEKAGFNEETRLKEHCLFDGKFIDVVIHSKINNDTMELRLAKSEDSKVLFNWANDKVVRYNSLNVEPVSWENHQKWFNNKLHSVSKIYLLFNNKVPIGQIRFDFLDDYWFIDYSIDEKYRGKGFGKIILELAIRNFNQGDMLKAIVKNENISSLKVFQKLGFEEEIDQDSNIICFIKKIN